MTETIRLARFSDRNAVRELYLQAFDASESAAVAGLAESLLTYQNTPEVYSLVAEQSAKVTGHIAYSPVQCIDHPGWTGYVLSPLAVSPDAQRRGIGSRLVKSGIEELQQRAADCVFVYGDPAYYGRFGFDADKAVRYTVPYKLEYAFGWQALELKAPDESVDTMRLQFLEPLCDRGLW